MPLVDICGKQSKSENIVLSNGQFVNYHDYGGCVLIDQMYFPTELVLVLVMSVIWATKDVYVIIM